MLALLICLLVLLTSATSQAVTAGLQNIIPNKYIVTFKRGISSRDIDLHLQSVSNIHARTLEHYPPLAGIERRYNISTFQGYAGAFSNEIITEIRASPVVARVEHDQLMYIDGLVTQPDASSWGLGAISHRSGAGPSEYIYDDSAGHDTFAYVIDTGVNDAHQDFGGRASLEWSFDDTEGDFRGHGTHVAGIIGGHQYGVAKLTNIVVAKVFDASGGPSNVSTVLDAYGWAVDDILGSHSSRGSRAHVSAINMSLGGAFLQAMNDAIQAAFEAGILTVVAAGNFAKDAAHMSPASAPRALTVGATTNENAWATYSNFGNSVNILAPGTNILSAGHKSPTDAVLMDGTSMATPHVTGLVLYLMSLYKYERPEDVWNQVMELGTRDRISGVPDGTPNLLAYNGNGA